MEDNLKPKNDSNSINFANEEEINKNNEIINHKIDEEEIKNGSNSQKSPSHDTPIENNSVQKEKVNSTTNNEKAKRHRRGKNETTAERTFKCPDCDKCYLSGPALVIHRKTKHGYSTEAEKKSRGRPKKEDQQETSYQKAQVKYHDFFNNDTRKSKSENEQNEEKITLEKVKDNISKISGQCKNDLFDNIEDIENYPFYKLIIINWDKNNNNFPTECFSDNVKPENSSVPSKYNSPPLDIIFFLYLKELSMKTNKNYFWFANKFIVLFREFINIFKKDQVKDEYKTDKAKQYSQLFSAEGIPESCNDFFLEFMQQKNYYGLNEKELIELAQHFCFWLYTNKFTHSYLTLL